METSSKLSGHEHDPLCRIYEKSIEGKNSHDADITHSAMDGENLESHFLIYMFG